jgi:glycerol-3-phosphate dehydrogenase (NAD(P)+)
MRAGVIGGGRMARAVARVLRVAGADVKLWARREEQRAMLAKEIAGLVTTDEIGAATQDADLIFIAVPADAIGEVAHAYGDFARGDQIVLHASRGVAGGFTLPHQLIRANTCVRKIGVLGGPLHANELASGLAVADGQSAPTSGRESIASFRPLAAVLASRFQEVIAELQTLTKGTSVVVHGSKDVIGVEIAGALSNVAAIAAGMSDGLQLGDTPRGVLLTRGLAEAKRLGVALGADAATFAGLAGVGDLIPRRVSSTDRHRVVGAQIASGKPLEEALRAVGGAVEGVLTAREAAVQANKLGLDLPLVRAVDRALSGAVPAREALEEILRLDLELDLRAAGAAAAV